MEKQYLRQRLLAVLEYDGIPESKRVAHIAHACGCSRTTARRMLTIDNDFGGNGNNSPWLFDLAKGLNVSWLWLHDGNFERFDPRTARIQLAKIEGRSHEDVEVDIAPLLTGVEGEQDYIYVGYDYSLMDVMFIEQRRRMTKWEREKHQRLMLRLVNRDAKALRLSDMCLRGQITRTQLFSMM
jgi:hypothetical protein